MRNSRRVAAYLLLVLLAAHPSAVPPARGKDLRAKATLTERPKNPERGEVGAAAKAAGVRQQTSGAPESAPKSATVNFAELSRQEALAPSSPARQEPRVVPPPKTDEEGRGRPVPPDATLIREEAGASAAAAAEALAPSPAVTASFKGASATGWTPPDTQGAAGPNHLVVAVNGGLFIQSKTGVNLASATLVNFFAPATNNSTDVFDPRLQYDPLGNRWILIAVADRSSAASSVVVAVTQTSDPTGNWHLFRVDVDGFNLSWADFPMLGFNKDWIVVTVNMFPNPGSSVPGHSRLFVLNKATFYAGVTGSWTPIVAPSGDGFSIAPASTYDPNLSTLYLLQNWNGNFNGSGFLRLYTLTGAVGSEVLNNTAPGTFIQTPNPWETFPPGNGNFAPQLGTATRIHAGYAHIQNVVYRNGSLWAAHTVFLPAGGPTRSSVQWWQVNPSAAFIQQRGRIDDAGGGLFYAFPSIAVNKNNDVLIGYSRFSTSQFAGGGYAFRAGTDPLGALRDDTTLKAGEDVYSRPLEDGRNRWGDYSGATVDPSNDTDLWTLQEYASFSSTWATWWGRVGGDGSPTPGPLNNNFAAAQLISGNVGIISGSNVGATKEAGEPNHAGNVGGASVWYQWQAPASGTATFTTAGSSFDTTLAVYIGGSVGALTPLAGNDDVSGIDQSSRVVFNATAGTTYRIAVDGFNAATGGIRLNWNNVPPAPPNNNFSVAQIISGFAGSVGGTNVSATKEAGEPNHAANVGGASVWYQWQAPASGNVTFTTAGSNFDTLLGAYTGSSVALLTAHGGNDDASAVDLTSRIVFPVTAGAVYRIAVDGFNGDAGGVALNWNLAASCTFSISPTGQAIGSGGGSGSVGVTATAGCAWTAASNAAFITVTSGASGTGNSTVGFTVAANGTTSQRTGTLTIAGNTFTVTQAGAVAGPSVQLGAAAQSVSEAARKVVITVTRTGNTTAPASVGYATSDGTADRRKDYTQTLGTLNFAAGETSKTVTVFVADDTLLESAESFTFALSNASGATLGTPASSVVTINSDDAVTGPNPVGEAAFNTEFFVGQHYVDFFSREADAPGLAFWTGVANGCGAADLLVCRINVSGAFFLSIEFQQTGYLVERMYKAAYGDATGTSTFGGPHQLAVPIIRLEEFLPDTQRIGSGVVVHQPGWEALLEGNKVAFTQEFVQRQRFTNAFPATMSPAQFVDRLNGRAGGPLDASERQNLINELTANNTTAGRASVLRKVAEDPTLEAAEKNRAFVLMQFFGYLRRNPNDLPDVDYTGYDFWLGNLEKFNGNFVQAELVKAFLSSTEYRLRFGP